MLIEGLLAAKPSITFSAVKSNMGGRSHMLIKSLLTGELSIAFSTSVGNSGHMNRRPQMLTQSLLTAESRIALSTSVGYGRHMNRRSQMRVQCTRGLERPVTDFILERMSRRIDMLIERDRGPKTLVTVFASIRHLGWPGKRSCHAEKDDGWFDGKKCSKLDRDGTISSSPLHCRPRIVHYVAPHKSCKRDAKRNRKAAPSCVGKYAPSL